MVVDFTIEDHKYTVILIRHRLVAPRKIDNGEAPMSEKDTRGLIFVELFAIRPAMFESPRHRNQMAAVSGANETRNATHRCYFYSGKFISSRTRYALRSWLSKYVRTSISANSPISILTIPTRNVIAVNSGNGVKIIDNPFTNFKYNIIDPDMNEIASVNNPNPLYRQCAKVAVANRPMIDQTAQISIIYRLGNSRSAWCIR